MSEFRRPPSYPMFEVSSAGEVRGPRGRLLSLFTDKHGYQRVNAYYADTGKWKQVGVHALVCEAFHGPRPVGAQVAHGNGRRADNRARNLRWATPAQNSADKALHGTAAVGEKNPQAKLTDEAVREIRRRAASGATGLSVARAFGVSATSISRVLSGQTWAHVK